MQMSGRERVGAACHMYGRVFFHSARIRCVGFVVDGLSLFLSSRVKGRRVGWDVVFWQRL